jgi:hypothetical protein
VSRLVCVVNGRLGWRNERDALLRCRLTRFAHFSLFPDFSDIGPISVA